MEERLDQESLKDVIEIYNNVSAMLKSLQEKEKAIMESENNAWRN